MIRNAIFSDKNSIMPFCKDTFSWGDYIDQVWNFWLSEGNLFLFEKTIPVGMCHALYLNNQLWIEGIRIDPNFRRQKIASMLIEYVESIGRKKNTQFSYMLIDTTNISSISMANSLNYNIFQTWKFYSLLPKQTINYDIYFEKSLNLKLYSQYVKSWRWIPIDKTTLSALYNQNNIIKSTINGKDSVAILSDSEHFDKTLIVTLFSGSENSSLQIISFLQNYGIEKNYARIQILTRDNLPSFDSLEYRISFNLMKKSLI